MHYKHIHACIHTKCCISAWWNYKIQCKYILAQCVMHTRNMNRIFHTMTAFIEWNVPIDFQPSPKYFNKISLAAYYDALFWHACAYLCAEVHIEFYCLWMMLTFDPILDVYVQMNWAKLSLKKKFIGILFLSFLSILPGYFKRVCRHHHRRRRRIIIYTNTERNDTWAVWIYSLAIDCYLSRTFIDVKKKDHPSICHYVDACRWFLSLKFECYLVDTMWELS